MSQSPQRRCHELGHVHGYVHGNPTWRFVGAYSLPTLRLMPSKLRNPSFSAFSKSGTIAS